MQPNLAVFHLRRLRLSSFKGLVNCLFVEEAVLLIVLGFGLSFMRQKFVKKVSSVGTFDCPIKVHSSPKRIASSSFKALIHCLVSMELKCEALSVF